MPLRLLLICLFALVVRLGAALSQNHAIQYQAGSSDSGWYLCAAYTLVTDINRCDGLTIVPQQIASPPLYFLMIGVPQTFLQVEWAVIAVRVMQSFLSAALCFFAYRLAYRLTERENIGLIAAFALAIAPAFILEAGDITTETLYMFLLMGGVWLFVEFIALREPFGRSRWLTGSAALFGLAALTRAVILAYPLALAALLLLIFWKRGIKWAALFVGVYAVVVLSWTVYNLARWDRFVIAGDGLFAFIYLGDAGWDDPQTVDERLLETLGRGDERPTTSSDDPPLIVDQADYGEAAALNIGADPVGWARRRVSELGGAILQPHRLERFGGESLRALALDWLREDRTAAGLSTLIEGDGFWAKLIFYILHYAVLILGVIGMWRTRRRRNKFRWWISLPMFGFIAYTLAVHTVLLALPRYIFPAMPFMTIYAAAAFARRDQMRTR